MQTKILGRTGLEVPIVSLGTVFIGDVSPAGELWKEVDEDLGAETVVAAIEAGCTLVDTAPLYENTQSEKIIGRVLRERPDLAAKCTVTTKVGYDVENGGRDFSYDAIRRCVDGSLARLGLDGFDVLYIHDPMGFPMEDVMGDHGALGALRALQKEGVLKFVGIAANDPETNGPYIETGEFDAAVVPDAWSLLNRKAEALVFPAIEKHNVGVALATPLERGLLATGPVPGRNYLNRNFSEATLSRVAKIKDLCSDYGVPLVAVSLQWCSRHPLVATTIPGGRNKQEVVENAQAGGIDIPEALWDDLEPLIQDWEASHIVSVGD
ncbi:MAG: D-threo-aldose 1-dehydrogenase [Candidatus Latescibacterota bacterium]|jgi:D-threo-aldose 1-dehydrogenase